MRVTTAEEERERLAFAERAAACFADPRKQSYSDSNGAEPGELFALRWGMGDDCVLVFRVADESPVIYGQLIPREPKA